MSPKRIGRIIWILPTLAASLVSLLSGDTKRPFTVADDIELTLFNEASGEPEDVRFSPDGNYVAVWTVHGRLDLNRTEESLRFYRVQDIRTSLAHRDTAQYPSPLWMITRSADSTDVTGPSIGQWRWLGDSSGIAFVERHNGRNQRLALADLRKKND